MSTGKIITVLRLHSLPTKFRAPAVAAPAVMVLHRHLGRRLLGVLDGGRAGSCAGVGCGLCLRFTVGTRAAGRHCARAARLMLQQDSTTVACCKTPEQLPLVNVTSRCREGAAEVPRRCREGAAEVPRRCRGDAAAMPRRCRGDAAGGPRRCREGAAAVPRRCRGGAAVLRARGGAAEGPRRCREGAAAMPRRCRGGSYALPGQAFSIIAPTYEWRPSYTHTAAPVLGPRAVTLGGGGESRPIG